MQIGRRKFRKGDRACCPGSRTRKNSSHFQKIIKNMDSGVNMASRADPKQGPSLYMSNPSIMRQLLYPGRQHGHQLTQMLLTFPERQTGKSAAFQIKCGQITV
jgi:hypothetical protein